MSGEILGLWARMIRGPYAPRTGNGKGLGVSNLSRSFGERSEHHLILWLDTGQKGVGAGRAEWLNGNGYLEEDVTP